MMTRDTGSVLEPVAVRASLTVSFTGREQLLDIVNAVRAGRDAVRARLAASDRDAFGQRRPRDWDGPYLDGWSDALLALQLAACDASAAIADRKAPG